MLGFAGPIAFFSLWWIVGEFGFIDPLYLPILSDVIGSFTVVVRNGFDDMGVTLYRTTAGFIIAAACAIPFGILLGRHKKLYASLEFGIDFFRSLPAPALFPLALLFFGIGDRAKIAVAAFVGFWVILLSTIYGVWNASALRVDVAKVLGASKRQIVWQVIFFDALPTIFTGLRVALSLSLILVIVAEISIGAKTGLGQKIFDSYNSYRIPELYCYILITGSLGYVLSWIFRRLELRVIHWSGK